MQFRRSVTHVAGRFCYLCPRPLTVRVTNTVLQRYYAHRDLSNRSRTPSLTSSMRPRTVVFVACLAGLTLACDGPTEPRSSIVALDVAPALVQTAALFGATHECLSVRESSRAPWRALCERVEGFEYVLGYRNQITVIVSRLRNPPQDASNLRYQLVRVRERVPAPPPQST